MAHGTPAFVAFSQIVERMPYLDNPELYLTVDLLKGGGPGMGDLVRTLVGPPKISNEDLIFTLRPLVRLPSPDGDPRKDGFQYPEVQMAISELSGIYVRPYSFLGFVWHDQVRELGLMAKEGGVQDWFVSHHLLLVSNYSFQDRTGRLTLSKKLYGILREHCSR